MADINEYLDGLDIKFSEQEKQLADIFAESWEYCREHSCENCEYKPKGKNNKIDYDEILEEAKINTQTQNTLLGASAISVKDTLNDLYKTYHLDQDMLNSLQKKVDKVADAKNHEMKEK